MKLIVGAVASGTGKTSVCLALAAGLIKKGIQVNGFKVGPDYIDPMYMELVTGKTCYNLDPWMSSQEHVQELVSGLPGLSLIEGVMGYYDGPDISSSTGSTAHLTGILGSPAVLVVDARAMARSFGALVRGFVDFEDLGKNIKAIIANGCGSQRHADLLAKALNGSGLPPLVGAIPKKALPELASRHLGLQTPDSREVDPDIEDLFARAAEQYLDLDGIISLAGQTSDPGLIPGFRFQEQSGQKKIRVAVARDRAFNFYYQANLDVLVRAGADLIQFSPTKDRHLPQDIQMIYFGGGYPELYAYELSQNKSLRKDILSYAGSGGHIYAECGGLVYLCRDLKILNGQVFPMAGVLPFRASMLGRRKSLGYVRVSFENDCLLGDKGAEIRGHEYHYSEIEPIKPGQKWKNVYQVENSRQEPKDTLGISLGNVLASYVHVYFGHRPDVAQRIVEWIRGE
ncbi:cobyrinate a,c-diamide synthase [Desulfonatronovibrio hydrogenovorans]|uniref:cobyrinate a,c-diamide synthase n=1 Tax=Desulfonatronovibrio hydrogenovorans TaxID=53245 RepID=UPI00068AD16D|nr:cobyrinate a,c-diamide synthase [Desulfonatronovibrio hydrogenovorans]